MSRRRSFATLCLVLCASCAPMSGSAPKLGQWGVDLTSLDTAAKPGDDNRDIVFAPCIVGGSHELPARLFGIPLGPNDFRNGVVRKHFGQSIGTQEDDIAGLEIQFMNLDLHF